MSTTTDTPKDAAPLLAGVNGLTATDYAGLLQELADVYERFYLDDAERAQGKTMVQARQARELAEGLQGVVADAGDARERLRLVQRGVDVTIGRCEAMVHELRRVHALANGA